MSEKALKACADYARLNAEVKRLTKAIGDALDHCPGVKGKRDSMTQDDGTVIYGGDADETHLKFVYTPERIEPTYYGDGGYDYLSDAEILEELARCPACLAAHQAIQQRKAAKKQFAIVKRSIGAIGRAKLAREA